MSESARDLKKILSLITIGMVLFIVVFMALELITLTYAAPMVVDSIGTSEVGNGSSIILPEDEVNKTDGVRFSISPEINGTGVFVADYFIFAPDRPFSENTTYTVHYGYERTLRFRAVNESLSATLLTSYDYNDIIVSFNRDVVRSDAESLINFTPAVRYTTEWYGNTLVINPNVSFQQSCTFTMSGNVSMTNGMEGSINLEAKYIYGWAGGEATQVPEVHSTVLYVIIPPGMLAGLQSLEGSAYQTYYVLIVIAIVSSFAYAIYTDRHRFPRRLKKSINSADMKIPSDSVFFETSALLMATVSFSLISYYIIYAMHQNPTVPNMEKTPLWENLYALARAGVWEEIITRIPFIGIPLLLTHYAMHRKKAPTWRYFLGGGFEMDGPALFFLFMSALFFGLAHAFGGWDMFKVLPAMVGGLAMGYLFLKWGIYASIILHFSNDYMSLPSEVFTSKPIDSITNMMILAMVIIGVFVFYLYLKAFLEKFVIKKTVPASKANTLGNGGLYGPATNESAYSNRYPYGGAYEGNQGNRYPNSEQQRGYEYYNNHYYGNNTYDYQHPQKSSYTTMEITPLGYIRYSTETHGETPGTGTDDMPYAPYPFKCIRCGGRTAVFQDDGTITCGTCGMRYALRKESSVQGSAPPSGDGSSTAPEKEEKEKLE